MSPMDSVDLIAGLLFLGMMVGVFAWVLGEKTGSEKTYRHTMREAMRRGHAHWDVEKERYVWNEEQ